MKKEVFIDEHAKKELRTFSIPVQDIFYGQIGYLGEHGRLALPDAKKISKNLFEIRVQHKGNYRGLYAYVYGDSIIILRFFQKKSQKLARQHVVVAAQRLKSYE
jgi:phage-related protein